MDIETDRLRMLTWLQEQAATTDYEATIAALTAELDAAKMVVEAAQNLDSALDAYYDKHGVDLDHHTYLDTPHLEVTKAITAYNKVRAG